MRITANQVTMARIFLLPVPVYFLIYGETFEWWIAFLLLVLLGATDFIDGLMARREGPTRLGSLIDPVADKIFIAAIMLSMITIGIFPPFVVSILLLREFIMTALRSSVAIREGTIKTSVWGKLKTVIQMGGCGTIFFTIILPQNAVVLVCFLLSLPFLFLHLFSVYRKRKPHFWSLPVFAALALVSVVEYFFTKEINLIVQMTIIISITWASAIDYFVGSYRLFKKTGMMKGDWVRLLWAMVYGVFVSPLVAYFPVMVLPVLVSISLEFGLGGIDNIVVAENKRFYSSYFFLSSIFGLLFSASIHASIYWQFLYAPLYFSLGLAAASSIICGAFFGRHVDLFKRTLS